MNDQDWKKQGKRAKIQNKKKRQNNDPDAARKQQIRKLITDENAESISTLPALLGCVQFQATQENIVNLFKI